MRVSIVDGKIKGYNTIIEQAAKWNTTPANIRYMLQEGLIHEEDYICILGNAPNHNVYFIREDLEKPTRDISHGKYLNRVCIKKKEMEVSIVDGKIVGYNSVAEQAKKWNTTPGNIKHMIYNGLFNEEDCICIGGIQNRHEYFIREDLEKPTKNIKRRKNNDI